jgi:hypothetical protein
MRPALLLGSIMQGRNQLVWPPSHGDVQAAHLLGRPLDLLP